MLHSWAFLFDVLSVHCFFYRGQKLEQSYAFQQFTANVEEEEAWITEKLHLLSGGDYGDTMAAVQVIYFHRSTVIVLLKFWLEKQEFFLNYCQKHGSYLIGSVTVSYCGDEVLMNWLFIWWRCGLGH